MTRKTLTYQLPYPEDHNIPAGDEQMKALAIATERALDKVKAFAIAGSGTPGTPGPPGPPGPPGGMDQKTALHILDLYARTHAFSYSFNGISINAGETLILHRSVPSSAGTVSYRATERVSSAMIASVNYLEIMLVSCHIVSPDRYVVTLRNTGNRNRTGINAVIHIQFSKVTDAT